MALTPQDVLVHSLSRAQIMLGRFCADLTPAEYLHRPCAGGNCAAWIVGHLVLTERSALGRVGVTDLPPLPDGFEQRFARDEHAPKSADYGDVTVLLPLFDRHREMLIERVRGLSVEALEQPLPKPHPMFSTVAEVLNYMGTHASVHAGQITIIRRSLGRPPVI